MWGRKGFPGERNSLGRGMAAWDGKWVWVERRCLTGPSRNRDHGWFMNALDCPIPCQELIVFIVMSLDPGCQTDLNKPLLNVGFMMHFA